MKYQFFVPTSCEQRKPTPSTKEPTNQPTPNHQMDKYIIRSNKRKREDETTLQVSSTEKEEPAKVTETKENASLASKKSKSETKDGSTGGDSLPKGTLENKELSSFMTNSSGWHDHLAPEFEKPYFKKLSQFLKQEYQVFKKVYPPVHLVFNAFNQCTFEKVRVVIVGQDPYHKPNQAFGLSFAVNVGIRVPPSLVNIYKELENDVKGFKRPKHGDLTHWAQQGVLLLNAVLTVREQTPTSHEKHGWEEFTQAVLRYINKEKKNVVFLCWGKKAEDKIKKAGVDGKKHLILNGYHPSPLARNMFLGCKHFSKCNTYLKENGLDAIDWRLPMEPDHPPYT